MSSDGFFHRPLENSNFISFFPSIFPKLSFHKHQKKKKKEIQNYSRIARLIKIQRPPINQPSKMKIVKFVYNLRVHQLGETFVVVGFFSSNQRERELKKKRGEEGEGEK